MKRRTGGGDPGPLMRLLYAYEAHIAYSNVIKIGYSMEDKLFLEHTWTLFNHLKDSEDKDIIEAVMYFLYAHDFDIEALPERLMEAVECEIGYELSVG